MHVVPIPASTPDELFAISAAEFTRGDALAVLPDAMFWNHRATVLALAQAARRPAIYPERRHERLMWHHAPWVVRELLPNPVRGIEHRCSVDRS